MTVTKINVTDLRNNLANYLDFVRYEKRPIDITRQGKIIAQITPKTEPISNYSKVIKNVAGTLSAKKHPEWKNISSIKKWVNNQRKKAERY